MCKLFLLGLDALLFLLLHLFMICAGCLCRAAIEGAQMLL